MKALRLVLAIALLSPLAASAHELQHKMEDMGTALQTITDALIKNKPVTEAELRAASDGLLKATVEASKIMPETFNGPNGPQPLGPNEVARYKESMTKLLAALTELDQDIKAGKKAEAKDVLVTKVAPLKKEGHGAFKAPEK